MKKTSAQITRFESGNWYIEITETKAQFEAWIMPKKGGTADFMFGSPKKQHNTDGTEYTQSFDDFCEIVEANLPEYKELYKLEHID